MNPVDSGGDIQSHHSGSCNAQFCFCSAHSGDPPGRNVDSVGRSVHRFENIPCFYSNVDSLPNKLFELKARIGSCIQKPLVIGLTEVKPKNFRFHLQHSEIQLEGYQLFTNIDEHHIGRGVALYIHNSLHCSQFTPSTVFEESVWVTLNLVGRDSLLIGCIYRSDSGTDANNLHLLDLIDEIGKTNFSHKLLMGDFNLPNINWRTGTVSNAASFDGRFTEQLRDSYLFQHVDRPTRARGNNMPHILDLVLTNEEDMISQVEYASPIGKSDHCVIQFPFKCYTERTQSHRVKFYYDKGDYDSMRAEAANVDWDTVLTDSGVQEQWGTIKRTLIGYQNTYVPHSSPSTHCSSKRRNQNGRHFAPDQKCIRLIKHKHRLWTRYLETRDGQKYTEYCRVRNQVRSQTRKLAKIREQEIAREAKNNPKKFWQFINQRLKTKSGIPDLRCSTNTNGRGNFAVTDVEKAEVLSDFFSSVQAKEKTASLDLNRLPLTSPMTDEPLSNGEVLKYLQSIKTCKSPGPDGIHPRIIYELAQQICVPITKLFLMRV